ncbi:MAG TPA: alpha/beta hydrolase [Acidimicrobiales bacterium]|nr:alpha/beta hydrolase [Acidimicrobiales bacterium]
MVAGSSCSGGTTPGPEPGEDRPGGGRPATTAPAGLAVPGGVTVRRGLAYGTGAVAAPPGERRADLLLDLYLPAGGTGSDLRPAVVLVHGGGFVGGSRADAGVVRVATGLAERGVVTASIDYRLLGQRPRPSRRVAPLAGAAPASAVAVAADDTLTALDWLADEAADLGVDPERLGLVGSSAGAVTVDLVAYALDDHGIDAPSLRVVGSLWGGLAVPGRGGTDPVEQLEAGEAALFAVHGDADDQVPVEMSDRLVARARAEGVPHEYHRLAGGGHGYPASGLFTTPVGGGSTSYDRLLAFVLRALAPAPQAAGGGTSRAAASTAATPEA